MTYHIKNINITYNDIPQAKTPPPIPNPFVATPPICPQLTLPRLEATRPLNNETTTPSYEGHATSSTTQPQFPSDSEHSQQHPCYFTESLLAKSMPPHRLNAVRKKAIGASTTWLAKMGPTFMTLYTRLLGAITISLYS